jgi:hypothetical protein
MRTSLLALVLVVGCGRDICTRHSDCPPAQSCSAAGVCAIAPGDAGTDALEITDGAIVDGPADAADVTDGGTDAQ